MSQNMISVLLLHFDLGMMLLAFKVIIILNIQTIHLNFVIALYKVTLFDDYL